MIPDDRSAAAPRRTIRSCLAGLAVMAALLQQACGDGTGVTPPPSPQELQIVSGNGQMAPTGDEVAEPLRVRVIGSDDQPVSGATVRWSVAQGQATLDPAQSATNSSGEAETRVTLGATVGPVAVRATVEDLTPVTFSITALDPSSPLSFASVSADYHHSCGVTATGATYCWGANDNGQLGDGSTSQRLTPVRVAGGVSFATLATGVVHTCGLMAAGSAYCWGNNEVGQVGDGTTTQRGTPTRVTGDLSFSVLSAGFGSTCGVATTGTAYCWGYNINGQLGDGTTTSRLTPVPVAGGVSFAGISVGGMGGALAFLEGQHTCAVTAAGAAYCWGYNGYGRLGDGTTTSRLTPVPVAGDLSFTMVTAGANHTCGLTTEGTYCWGDGYGGQIGDGTGSDRWTPARVASGVTFVSLSAGGIHTCGLTAEGAAYCWGSNNYGQLGDGTTTQRVTPVAVAGGVSFAGISVGGYHTCGVTAAGAVYCWGHNGDGRLGDGTTTDRHTPTPVSQ